MKWFKRNVLPDDPYFERLRRKEYGRLDKNKQTYLDYTGGNLYGKSQIRGHQQLLLNQVLGNPHAANPNSETSMALITAARVAVLQFFNARGYTCVFTQNATAALKIVGESYPFGNESTLLLLSDNHNSVNGIREYCGANGGNTQYVPVDRESLQIDDRLLTESLKTARTNGPNLFAYPAQSNVTGIRHSLTWIGEAQRRGFDVLLDAAAFVPGSQLDLSAVRPDFVCVSFYKLFGYPTGIGCLLIRDDSFNKLRKPWFSGGTVSLAAVGTQRKFLSYNYQRFEDGTLNYADLPAVKAGLVYINTIGMPRIHRRIGTLIHYLKDKLVGLKHSNGEPVVRLYGTAAPEQQGGTLAMNFFDPNGNKYSTARIDNLAVHRNISIRSGCFCNPGIDEIVNGITATELFMYFEGRNSGSYQDMVNYLGKPRGAIRVSVGIATVKKDLDAFIELASNLKDKRLEVQVTTPAEVHA